MRPKNKIYLVLFVFLMADIMNAGAQEKGGCDLCGPASGGSQNIVSGNYSVTTGVGCEASGSFSMASGFYAKANAASTIALGKYVRSVATNSMVIGSGMNNSDSRALINNVPNSLMIGFNSSVPTLFVSNSSGFNTTGKVGVGCVTSPQSKLHIKSDLNEDAGIILEPKSDANKAYFQIYDDRHRITVEKGRGMSIAARDDRISFDANEIAMNAKVSINASDDFVRNSDYAMAVNGGILTTEVLVKEVSEWHDYVFEDTYNLMSMDELENYINNNGHLPDIPSEDEIVKEGYNMVEMDGLLLKKIEELTLYAIELNKLLESQQEFIESLQSK